MWGGYAMIKVLIYIMLTFFYEKNKFITSKNCKVKKINITKENLKEIKKIKNSLSYFTHIKINDKKYIASKENLFSLNENDNKIEIKNKKLFNNIQQNKLLIKNDKIYSISNIYDNRIGYVNSSQYIIYLKDNITYTTLFSLKHNNNKLYCLSNDKWWAENVSIEIKCNFLDEKFLPSMKIYEKDLYQDNHIDKWIIEILQNDKINTFEINNSDNLFILKKINNVIYFILNDDIKLLIISDFIKLLNNLFNLNLNLEVNNITIYPKNNHWVESTINFEQWSKIDNGSFPQYQLEKIINQKIKKIPYGVNLLLSLSNQYKYQNLIFKNIGYCFYTNLGNFMIDEKKINIKNNTIEFTSKKHIIMDSWLCNWDQDFKDIYTSLPLFDTNMSFIYNENQNLYYIYTRTNINMGCRYICYNTSKDLTNWSGWKLVNIPKFDYNNGNYYQPNIQIYPNSDKFVSINIYELNQDYYQFKFLYSNDGQNFNSINLSDKFSRENKEIHDDKLYIIADSLKTDNETTSFLLYEPIENCDDEDLYNMCDDDDFDLENMDDELIDELFEPKEEDDLYKIRDIQIYKMEFKKDRIAGIFSDNDEIITTNKITQFEDKLIINYQMNKNGYIKIELYDENNNLLSDQIEITKINSVEKEIKFKNKIKISNNNYLKIKIKNCILYTINLKFEDTKINKLYSEIKFYYHEYYPCSENDMTYITKNVEYNGIKVKKIIGELIYNEYYTNCKIKLLYNDDIIREFQLFNNKDIIRENIYSFSPLHIGLYNLGKIKFILDYFKINDVILNHKDSNLFDNVLADFNDDLTKPDKYLPINYPPVNEGSPAKVFDIKLL